MTGSHGWCWVNARRWLRSNVVRRFVVTIGGRVFGALFQALLLAMLTRSLGVDDFGVYAIASSACLFSLALLELGTGATVLRLAAEPDRKRVLSLILIWRASSTVVFVAAAILVGLALGDGHWPLVIATVVYVAGETVGDLVVGVLQGEMRPGLSMTVLLIRRALPLVAFAVLGLTTEAAIAAMWIGGSTGAAAIATLGAFRLARPIGLLAYIRRSLAIIVTTTTRSVSQLDSLVVGATGGIMLAGLYGAAARLFYPVNIAVTSLVQVLIPEMSALSDERARMKVFLRSRQAVTAFGILISASAALSPWIVDVLFGADFAAAAPIVGGVLVSAGLSAIAQLYMSWFYATKVPRAVAIGTVFIVFGAICLLAVAAPVWGIWGCAATVVLWRGSTLALVATSWYRATREVRRALKKL